MIDCSHGNSEKDYRRQGLVADSICEQVAVGSPHIFGAMLESHLVEGRQDYSPGCPARYGQSITDACISLEETERILERFAQAQRARRIHRV
jgi:3-deoxy-7-phosphoheptulonate synthase